MGSAYHGALREGDSEFYRLEKEGPAIGLIQTDAETRSVQETQGRGDRELKLSREEALEVLRALKATADDEPAFSRVGAFGGFLQEPKPTPIEHDLDEWKYLIGCFPDKKQIVVKRRRPAHPEEDSSWSLFAAPDPMRLRRRRRSARCSEARSSLASWSAVCCHDGAMTEGEFVDLLLRCPGLAERIHEALHG